MASKRRERRKECGSKIKFPDKDSAIKAATSAKYHFGTDKMRAYRCGHCGHWHFGHYRGMRPY